MVKSELGKIEITGGKPMIQAEFSHLCMGMIEAGIYKDLDTMFKEVKADKDLRDAAENAPTETKRELDRLFNDLDKLLKKLSIEED